MSNNITKLNFNLDSYKVLLSGAYGNILLSDNNLAKLEEYLVSDDTLLDEDMSKGKMIELYRAIVARQKNSIQLLTQLISISNRNEQIKLLLEELTRIKELSDKKNDVSKLSPKAQALIAGLQKTMEDKYNTEYGLNEEE